MSFPTKRLRRLRISEKMRELVQETTLTPKDFICPVFVQEDLKSRIKVESMSEIERLPLEEVNQEVREIINLGSGKPVKIKRMVELIVKIIGKGIPVFGAVRYRKGENMFLVADVSKLKKLIKWKPKFSLEKGIRNTIKFYEKKF